MDRKVTSTVSFLSNVSTRDDPEYNFSKQLALNGRSRLNCPPFESKTIRTLLFSIKAVIFTRRYVGQVEINFLLILCSIIKSRLFELRNELTKASIEKR